jgi:hypothetical protein
MAKTAAQMAAAWVSAMQSPNTAAKYKAGIAATTVNPMQLAASPAAQAKYAANTAAAVSSGRMAAALNAVSMQTWQNNASGVGAMALTSGATKATGKVQAHFNKWAPIYAQAKQAAEAIPNDGSMAAALARVQAAITVMKQAAGKS